MARSGHATVELAILCMLLKRQSLDASILENAFGGLKYLRISPMAQLSRCSLAAAMSSSNEPEIWRGVLESLSIGVCVLDVQKRIVLWSDGAERITGYLRHEVVGRSCVPQPILHCDQPGCEFCSEECPLARAMKTAHRFASAALLHHKAGHEIPVRTHALPVHNQHGSIIGAVETFEEIHEPANSEERIRTWQSDLDPVTSATRRDATETYMARAMSAFREKNIPFGILFLRVEGLPGFRARFGTEAASSFLRLVARTLEGALGMAEVVGRWAEDQFLVLLLGCEEEALRSMRERVRRIVAGEGIEWWGERHSLPVSIGEASIRPDDTLEMLIDRAQASLDTASAWLAGRGAMDSQNVESTGSE